MLNFYETFYNSKTINDKRKENICKLISLKSGKIGSLNFSQNLKYNPLMFGDKGEGFSIKFIVYNKEFNIIHTIDNININDIIQINTGEILILSEKKYVYFYNESSFELIKKLELSGEPYATSILELSNGNLLFTSYFDVLKIELYKLIYENNKPLKLQLINKRIECSYLYCIVGTKDDNYAYTRTFNYKLKLYDICFSNSEKVFWNMDLPKKNIGERGKYFFTFNEKLLLVGCLNGILVIGLNTFEIIQDLNILPFKRKENLGNIGYSNLNNSSLYYSHKQFYLTYDNITREFFENFCKIGKNAILVGDSNGSLYLLEYKNKQFCLKQSKDIFREEKFELKKKYPDEFNYFEYYLNNLFISDNRDIIVYNNFIGKIYSYKIKW